MKKVGLLVIHGIGTTSEDFDKRFKKAFIRKVEKLGKDPDEISYRKVFWSEYINDRQEKYLDEIRKQPGLKLFQNFIRKFVLNSLGDASGYQSKLLENSGNYFRILRAINTSVRELRSDLGSDNKPLIIFAHSLGGFVISNYIWDAHKKYTGQSTDWPADLTLDGKFEHMVNLAGLITYGCNIPLFVLGYDPIAAIHFPHQDLAPTLRDKAQWLNCYDPEDVLGWPLKPLRYSFDGKSKPDTAKSYDDVVSKDIVMNVGGLLSWNPLSHIFYWTDNRFLRLAAEFISPFL
jgi:hypothetical protein